MECDGNAAASDLKMENVTKGYRNGSVGQIKMAVQGSEVAQRRSPRMGVNASWKRDWAKKEKEKKDVAWWEKKSFSVSETVSGEIFE